MKKRVLFMHQASSIGGGSYCLLNILKTIDRTYIEPIACLASDGPLRVEIEKLDIKVLIFHQMMAVPYNLSLTKMYALSCYYKVFKSLSLFKNILKEKDITGVYLNNMMLYPYLRVAKDCGCKTILHCREHWPLNEHIYQLQWARNAVYKYADELIAINHYSASIFPEKKAIIIYDWIDMDTRDDGRTMSDILGEDASQLKVFLYTGGISNIKGPLNVIRGFLTTKNPNYRLLVLGIDKNMAFSGMKFKLKHLFSKLGLYCFYEKAVIDALKKDNRIVCIPANYMMAGVMKQCYCALSYYTIPHANLALAEGVIMGLPTIAAQTEESMEYSLNGSLACLYRINDYQAFLERIKDVNNLIPKVREQLDYKSKIVKMMFDKDSNMDRLNVVLKSLYS